MNEESKITVTRADLVKAFTTWDKNAKDGKWPDNPDAERSADYLIELLAA